MRLLLLLCLCVMVATGTPAGAGPQEPMLKPGDPAPPFSLPGSDGKTYSLSDFAGLRPVVIAWFPKAFAKL